MKLVHATDDRGAPRSRRQGCLRAAGITALILLALTDLFVAYADRGSVWPALLVLAPGLAVVLWPVARRPAWLTPQLGTAVPACVSAALTVIALLIGRRELFGPDQFGLGETAVLLCLLLIAVRTCPPRWVAGCAVLNGAAAISRPLRLHEAGEHDDSLFGIMLILVLLVGIIAGLGGYLRTLDHRRGVAVTETRRAERFAMAVDLHDFVAHHVTGILVQTQMARMMATHRARPPRPGPCRHRERRHRGPRLDAPHGRHPPRQPAGHRRRADRRPVGDLAALADLVAGFGGPIGPKAVLRRDPAVPADLPHEIQAAAHRVVQEALTNIRRHAADATEVTVDLTCEDGALQVTVRDDGRGGTQMPHAARGGGFGIVGLTERVTALAGEIHAGPRPDQGWEVHALLPTTRKDSR